MRSDIVQNQLSINDLHKERMAEPTNAPHTPRYSDVLQNEARNRGSDTDSDAHVQHPPPGESVSSREVNGDNDGFTVYQGKRPGRKERQLQQQNSGQRGSGLAGAGARRKPTFGTKTEATILGGKRTRDLFIYNISSSATPEQVVEYIKSQDESIDITVDNVTVQSKEDAHSKSFRVTVDSAHFDIINSDSFWPNTIAYRPFFYRRARKTTVEP